MTQLSCDHGLFFSCHHMYPFALAAGEKHILIMGDITYIFVYFSYFHLEQVSWVHVDMMWQSNLEHRFFTGI